METGKLLACDFDLNLEATNFKFLLVTKFQNSRFNNRHFSHTQTEIDNFTYRPLKLQLHDHND